jgi:acyl dehydratase
MSGNIMYFADFVPGTELGRASEVVSAEQLAEWAELYPWDQPEPGTVPTGLATVLLMRGFHKAIPHRPPGNIHVCQTMQAHAPILVGEELGTAVSCLSAERKGERRKLELAVTGEGADGRLVFDGVITLYWAA